LAIPADADCLWHRLDKDVRYQVRKAERAGLAVEAGGAEQLASFYDVFAVRARVLLVRRGRTVIGGLMTIAFKDRLTVPWASCLKQYFSLCPNMLLYWEALRRACAGGFRRFDFGRSTRDSGTHRFKQQWGAE